MLSRAATSAALLLAGCQPSAEQSNSNMADGDSTTSVTGNGASEDPAGNELEALPPSNEALRFIGLWAADEASCKDKAWRFTDASLSTPAGSRCTFSRVTPVAGGYDIAARCTAEGPETDDMIELRFAESARAMLFRSDSIADAGLVFCGNEA